MTSVMAALMRMACALAWRWRCWLAPCDRARQPGGKGLDGARPNRLLLSAFTSPAASRTAV